MKITLEIPDSACAGVITILHSYRLGNMKMATRQLFTDDLKDGAVFSIDNAGAEEGKDDDQRTGD